MTKISNALGLGQGITDAERERRKKIVEAYRKADEAFERHGVNDPEPYHRLLAELGIWRAETRNMSHAEVVVETASMLQGAKDDAADVLDDAAERLIESYLAGELTPERRDSIGVDLARRLFGSVVN